MCKLYINLAETLIEVARLTKAAREIRREGERRRRNAALPNSRDMGYEDFKLLIEAAEDHIRGLVADWREQQLQRGGNDW
jgi:hypothetical protein